MRRLKILLVEDEGPKLAHIRKFLRESFSQVSVIEVRSVTSALDAFEEHGFDLILLDMSLPTFDVGQGERGGRPQGFGGIEILRHLEMAGEAIETLVLTGYEAFPDESGAIIDLATLHSRLVEEFPNTVRGVVHFNSALEGWKSKIRVGVEAALRRKEND